MDKKLYKYIEIANLKEMLNKTEKQYANNIAYKIKKEKGKYQEITHKEVRKMVKALGTSLIDMGLKNKRIALIGENRYEWEIAYLSIVCGTGIIVPLDKALPENEIKKLIERSKVDAIIYSKKYEETFKKIKKEGIGNLKYLISMDTKTNRGEVYSLHKLIEKGEKLIKAGNREFIDSEIDNEETSVMLFTSGTTSESKIVALSHKNICSNLMDIASILDIDSKDIFLSFLPTHHVFECTVGFLFALYKGAQTVFCDGVRHIIENMKEYKVSVMASVPAIYERTLKTIRKELQKEDKLQEILEKEETYKYKTMEEKKKVFSEIHDMLGGNIKLLISGAASLNPEVEEKYRNLGINLVQGYGLTETSPVIAIGNKKYSKIGSVGKTVPSVEAKIVNCDEYGMGELVVKGPNIMKGYFENKEETEKVLKDGWFYTGDLAKIDDEGYIFICGRKKSVIVLKNGKNIFPEEMENLINTIDGVEESFIFGKPISKDENDIKVFAKIVYNEQAIQDIYNTSDEEEIHKIMSKRIKEINQEMPKYKSIRGIILTQEPLIKTTTNKIKRQGNLDKILKEGITL